MSCYKPAARRLVALLLTMAATAVAAQNPNIPEPVADIEARLLRTPLVVLDMEQARPRLGDDDRTTRVLLGGADGEEPISAKWKPVGTGAQGFNNEPRYELAAYRFQQLFLDEDEYVVPPTVLRSQTLEEYASVRGEVQPTLRGTSSVLFLLSYWVQNVTNANPFRPELLESDPNYARHWGNVNILTHLIDHKDGNVGNLLISTVEGHPRIFSVDNDVAFGSEESHRGTPWRNLRVNRLPQQTVERLRALTTEELTAAMGVVAEFRLEDGHLMPVELGPNLNPRRGVRVTDERVQLGLTQGEIRNVEWRLRRLLRDLDRGRITTF